MKTNLINAANYSYSLYFAYSYGKVYWCFPALSGLPA